MNTKYIKLGICIVLLILFIGILISMIFFGENLLGMRNTYYKSIRGYSEIQEKIHMDKEIKNITVEYPGDIEVCYSKDEKLHIYIKKDKKMKVGYKIAENTHLKIRSSWNNSIKILGSIKIEIPRNKTLEEVKISGVNSEINLSVDSQNIEVDNVNSDINIDGKNKFVGVNVVNGDIYVNMGESSECVDAKTVNGNLSVLGKNNDLDINIESLNGSINYLGNIYKNSFKNGNAKISIFLESINGDIIVK